MFSHNFNLSHSAKAVCTHATIKVASHHRQEYEHQYAGEKVTEQPGRRRCGAESTNHHCDDVAAEKNITRTNILTTTMRTDPKLIWRSKI
jgi:hypothetical protein